MKRKVSKEKLTTKAKDWAKKHKTGIIVAGAGVIAAVSYVTGKKIEHTQNEIETKNWLKTDVGQGYKRLDDTGMFDHFGRGLSNADRITLIDCLDENHLSETIKADLVGGKRAVDMLLVTYTDVIDEE